MVAIQIFSDLTGWHSHVHAITREGLFKRNGAFIRIINVNMEQRTVAGRERMFDLLLQK